MKLKIFALFICSMFFCSAPVLADNDKIINGDFEYTTSTFTNVSIYGNTTYEGTFCGNLKDTNTVCENDIFIHKSEYIHSLSLEKGKIYKLSMMVREVGGEGVARVNTDYNSKTSRIFFDIQNADDTWQSVSCAFIAGATGNFDIGIRAYTKSAEGILIDLIELSEEAEKPSGMEIIGSRNAFVPPYGEERYKYTAAATDKNGNIIPVISGKVAFEKLPEGVIAGDDGEIIVSGGAIVGESFKVKTVGTPENMALPQKEIRVSLVNNYISNGSFTDFPKDNGFICEKGSMEILETSDGNVAKIKTIRDENGFSASIAVEKTYVLMPGKMYVLRANITSDIDYVSRYTQVSKGILDSEGNININISNAGGEPSDILSVIRVENEGIYKISLSFTNPDERPVYAKNIGLYEEESRVSEILIKAPAHITLPEEEIKIPLHLAARNQEGQLIEGALDISAELFGGNENIYLEGNILTVTPKAKQGRYHVMAKTADGKITKSTYIEISKESVGDGGFEKYVPGEWFSTAEPSVLSMISSDFSGFDGNGEKSAMLIFGGNVSAVLSDSVFKFKGGQVYVFGGNFKTSLPQSNTILSLLLCDVNDINYSETVAVLQCEVGNGKIRAVFTPPKDITGRIMLGFTDGNSEQTVLFDDLYIEKATISCGGVSVSGYPYNTRVITGIHTLNANFDAVEISTYRWLISKNRDGVYMPIEGETEKSLSIQKSMVGSYVKFEVTPISLNGPVFGESVMSSPVAIYDLPTGSFEAQPLPQQKEEHIKNEEKDEENTKNEVEGLNVVNIYSESYTPIYEFFDIANHWARDDINLLSACSIANGKENLLFMPDEEITRAEFSAFIMRAFSLAPLYYTGTFDDVKTHNWYSGVVETISKYGIASGVNERMFAPNEPITREQMAAITMRAMALSGVKVEGAAEHFADHDKISSYAHDYVYKGANAGIITGFPDGEFKPLENATRAEAIVLIKRMITYVLENSK